MGDPEELAEFHIIGRLVETLEVKISSGEKKTPYCKPCIKVKAGPKAYERKWFMVCFGDTAEDFCARVKANDTVEVNGELQVQHNKVQNRWETSFILRRFNIVEEAPENDAAAVAVAQLQADLGATEF